MSSHSDLTSKKRCWKLSAIKISRNRTRDRQSMQSVAGSAAHSLHTRALCISGGFSLLFLGNSTFFRPVAVWSCRGILILLMESRSLNSPLITQVKGSLWENTQANCHHLSFPTSSPQVCTFGLLSLCYQATALKSFLCSLPFLFCLFCFVFKHGQRTGWASLVAQ